jgi:3'-phosphoadenosine 5'-phosphosulfate sulfotransferase (PAPS reductase)/FAD synthetase
MQTALDPPALFDIERPADPALRDYDVILVASSAGKDSQAMLDRVVELGRPLGVLDRITVVHNDLGVTDSGIPVEWPGTRELAEKQTAHYGLRFEVTRRELGGLFQQIRARGMWPSSAARYCTSDQKTSQAMKLVTRLVAETGITDRQVRVLYCVGLRAEESRGRAAKQPLAVDASASSGRREVTRSHPILRWTEAEVWARIEESGVPHHEAYDLGMDRLSCSLCVLASKKSLVRAAQLRPDLAAEYRALEVEMGHQFRVDMSMADIIAEAERQTAAGLPAIGA